MQQTDPPSVAIIDLFPDGGPGGEIQEYPPLQDEYVVSCDFDSKALQYCCCCVHQCTSCRFCNVIIGVLGL